MSRRSHTAWIVGSFREKGLADPNIAIPVITSIKRHLWYLTKELVVLSLFNEKLGSLIRSVMSKKLFSTPRPDVFNVGEPKFPTIDEKINLFYHL
jgi:hypothetical protein